MGIPSVGRVADALKLSLAERDHATGIEAWARNTAYGLNNLVSGHIVERITPTEGDDENGRLRLSIYADSGGCTDIIEGPARWIIGNLLKRFDATGKLGVRKVKP